MPDQDDIHLVLFFCDESTADEVYHTTRMGVLEARDAFLKYAENAQNNDKIWMMPPHVVKAELRHPSIDDTVLQEFPCPCPKHQRGVLSNA